MNQYTDLLTDILDNGVVRDDRTGTGTKSVFGRMLRFDLNAGFPLLTLRKIFFDKVVDELLWFISGSTNINDLGVGRKFWEEFDTDGTGELGPIYSAQWRAWGAPKKKTAQLTPMLRDGLLPTYLGVANGTSKEGHILAKTWEGMINRCYNPNYWDYGRYGGKGVSVCNRWLEFSAFAEDAIHISGWENKKNDWDNFDLDKDGLGHGFLYSPNTCQWISSSENVLLSKQQYLHTVEKDGAVYEFTSPTVFCRQQGIDDRNFSDLWTGRKNAKKRYGFSLVSREPLKKVVDQLHQVIESIKSNPNSRRHLVSAWNVGQLDEMRLPPCHYAFQFYVANGKLSCIVNMRSSDVFIGLPANIASYALLTHMIAQVCGLGVGELVMSLADAHLYLNHVDAAEEVIERDKELHYNLNLSGIYHGNLIVLPTLTLNPDITDIDSFTAADIHLHNYNPLPHIPVKLAV